MSETEDNIKEIDLDVAYTVKKILSTTDQIAIDILKDRLFFLKEAKKTLLLKSGCWWCQKIKPWLKKTPPFKWLFLLMACFFG